MPVTLVAGDLATDIINQSQRVIDMQDSISELEPNNAPFVAILRKIGKYQAKSPKVEWLEDESMPRFDVMSAAVTGSAVSAIPVTNASYFRVGDGVRITETGEFVEVTGVSASGIGVTRGVGNTSAVSCTSAAGLYIVNNANAEGASLRTIKTVRLVNQSNFCQIIRTPFGVTGTEMASQLYGQYSNDRVRLQHKYGLEHERQIEATVFWGAKKEDTTTAGAPKRWAGGCYEFIQTNVYNAGGVLTRANFENLFLRKAFRFGSDRKVLFCSPLLMQAIDGFAWNGYYAGPLGNQNMTGASRVNYNSPASEYGVAVKTYVCSQGTVDIVMKRHWNDNTNLSGDGFLLDLDAIKLATLRDTKLLLERQANDADKLEDEYLSELSLIFEHERRHGLITGVTG
jgi:hypothetical protein